MKYPRALLPACLVLCYASVAVAQDKTALYGRVVGSDHTGEAPPGWVVRVTAIREGTTDILDQRDSARELYCVRVPANARVRLSFETSFRPSGAQLGYGSGRIPETIDTSPADRRDTFRPQPDVILPRKYVQTGANARIVMQELETDIAIARETRSVDLVGAKMVTYRDAYRNDPLIMADIDRTANAVAGFPEFKPMRDPDYNKHLKELTDAHNVRRAGSGGFEMADGEGLLRLASDKSVFSDLRSQAVLALVAYYEQPRLIGGETLVRASARRAIPPGVLEFFRAQTDSSSSGLLLASSIALAKIGTPEDKQTIVQSVNSGDAARAFAAIVAVGEATLVDGAPALAALLQKESTPMLEVFAAQSLARLARAKIDVAATALKYAVIQDSQSAVRMQVAERMGALVGTYPEMLNILKGVEKNDVSPEVRAAARISLERTRP